MPTSHGDELDPITRHDNEILDVTVYDAEDNIKNITSDTLIFEARIKATAPPIFTKTSDDATEIQKTDAPNGKARIFIDPADTDAITKALNLTCTLSDIDIAGRVSSIVFTVPVNYRA